MIVRVLGACALLVVSSPLTAQVVGHLPSESPYQDATGRHMVGLQIGGLLTGKVPAGVGPKSGTLVLGRYEYDVPGPLLLSTRMGFAPSLERTVLDPLLTGDARTVGPRRESLLLIDGGLVLSLSGDKAWRGWAPRAHANIGMIASMNSDYDVGGYRFGPKFTPSWGLGVRRLTAGNFEIYADLTQAAWRMDYPNEYTDAGSTVTPSIIGTGRKNPWVSNIALTFGVTRVWGR